jgi:hypothetical protein
MTKETEKLAPSPEDKPITGGLKSGERQQEAVKQRDTKPLAPEAQGGAGAGRKWPGDS